MQSTAVAPQYTCPAPVPDEPTSIVPGWLERFKRMSPDALAQFFRDRKVVGMPGNPHGCVLAAFFRRVTGNLVRVDGSGVFLYSTNTYYSLPTSCRRFAYLFDSGQYSDLCAPPAPIIRSNPVAVEIPANVWDQFVAHFKATDDTVTLTYVSKPVAVIGAPINVPELVGA